MSGRLQRGRLPLFAAAVVAAALIVPVQASAAGPLISQNRPVTASSSENAAFGAASAVDGDLGTRWSSSFGDPQWIQIDLGSSARVDQVVLAWETASARAYTLSISADGTTWQELRRTTTGPGGTETLPVTGTGRYVRLDLTQRATQWGYSLWEFQVFGTPGTGTAETLLSYGRAGTASTFQDDANCGQCTPAKAFDRDPATRWATSATNGWVDPGWISVDLGATATISKVVLQWDPAFATAYRIEVSDNNSSWREIYSTTTGRGFKETLTVSGTGRYVRMYGTARSNGYGYSLWEFQVYGTGGAPITPPPLPPNPSFPGRLVWGDEFNAPAGTGPDASKWQPETGPGVNNELQYYTNNNNARHDGNGNLVLQARREVTPGSACPVDPVSGSGTCQYTSARLNTYGKFTFTYGRVEARIKVSSTQGLWPAFWMLGADFFDQCRPWPNTGEIDIMEHVGKEPNRVYSTLHAPQYFGAGGYGSPLELGQPASSAFRTFAVEWDSSHMTFSVDGNRFFTVDREQLETTRGPWVFDHPFFLIINNAVGGDWPGPPGTGTQLPQDMVLDYVRVYQ
ncbi:discoidin domain-containing protein [Lentzea flaviverrucosa]|uniref:F5/8 type C domain-containing protein n=1 Tax=Lentzea flaviverrucosa TaxID=200379 RepID=A0A1H9KGH0_9PSEU|nr:discoidin domain-containing protein [Lentzea flaviverrucosa]RDI17868.1 F5/8 type C domain-containing protein [Lentzea flaviverrucosa]SEQ98222.1 F5/8 type C domain-containing protein [Lentzea flaviverrucosa]